MFEFEFLLFIIYIINSIKLKLFDLYSFKRKFWINLFWIFCPCRSFRTSLMLWTLVLLLFVVRWFFHTLLLLNIKPNTDAKMYYLFLLFANLSFFFLSLLFFFRIGNVLNNWILNLQFMQSFFIRVIYIKDTKNIQIWILSKFIDAFIEILIILSTEFSTHYNDYINLKLIKILFNLNLT